MHLFVYLFRLTVFVKIEAVLKVFTYKYTPQLQNKSSPVYKETERNFTATVSKKFPFNPVWSDKMRLMKSDAFGGRGRGWWRFGVVRLFPQTTMYMGVVRLGLRCYFPHALSIAHILPSYTFVFILSDQPAWR